MPTETQIQEILPLLKSLESNLDLSWRATLKLIKKHLKSDGSFFSKPEIIKTYKYLTSDPALLKKYQLNGGSKLIEKVLMKPIRTMSGVAPVTVLTKPFPCPGKCIFCPNDLRMPKSYLADEPGAQRAEKNYFDPYLQTYNRLNALNDMGHQTDKVELIVLGGTWTAYPESYQIWFIKECFRAMNDFKNQDQRSMIEKRYRNALAKKAFMSNLAKENEAIFADKQIKGEEIGENYNQLIAKHYLAPEKELGIDQWQSANWSDLEKEQQINESTQARSVGLVLETRPDEINETTVLQLRRLGATKVQLGVQSLNDEVLELNKRGHGVAMTRKAFALLRQAGFKIHVHWMANLYGSNVEEDQADFLKLFNNKDFRPDEIKIYPCSLIETAELMQYFKKGLWRPYSYSELLTVMTFALTHTPPYCRITRVVRDIPAGDIVSGNKKSNFRQIAQDNIKELALEQKDIRAREIRNQEFDPNKVELKSIEYETAVSKEVFFQFVVPVEGQGEKILAFLRLSLPKKENFIEELKDQAIIREIHVYGKALAIGSNKDGRAQHFGFGKQLIEAAKKRAKAEGFSDLAVISAIGTRGYYQKRGFNDGDLYQTIKL